MFGCHKQPAGHGKVYIKANKGKYTFYRNGEPFVVRGGAGFTYLKELRSAGGNTIRVWDTTRLQKVLDSAQRYGLAVIVGLPMPSNNNMAVFYDQPALVSKHHQALLRVVERYSSHPALLCWCLGNELAFPYKPTYNNFYTAFNRLVKDIHLKDPDHPITTTVMSFQKKNIVNIKLRTDIDFISFNIFGAIKTLKTDLEEFKWYWDGPFLITEWGIEGPWVSDLQNAWGAYIEDTSEKKAEKVLEAYQKYMPDKDPRFLGEMIFYWGQKQELTPTWFSLFDSQGHKTGTVDVMSYIWSGKRSVSQTPPLKYMLLNEKGGQDDILLAPGSKANARVLVEDTSGVSYQWQLLREDWYKPNGTFSERPPRPLGGLLSNIGFNKVEFRVPDQEGPYRLFVYARNSKGYVATANTPFYVISEP